MRAGHREGVASALAFLVLACATPTRAGNVEFILPVGCLPGDGGPAVPFHVLVLGAASAGNLELTTDVGTIEAPEPLGSGLFRSRFVPPLQKEHRDASWRARWSGPGGSQVGQVTARLCPAPAGVVEVSAKPDRLLAEEDRLAVLEMRVLDELGRPVVGVPPAISTNVGKVEQVQEMGEGRYTAVFRAPSEPYPQVAIITVANPLGARLDRVAAGRVVIPIAARLSLPGRTTPGVRMTVAISNRTFGPVVSDALGRFELPVLVPPGFGRAQATSVDRVGNRQTRVIDLFLPETNQLGLWAYPLQLPADGVAQARLLVTTIDPFGAPTDVGKVRVKSGAGIISPIRRLGPGLFEAYYRAPLSVGSGHDHIEVSFPEGGGKSRAELDLSLKAGPASQVRLILPEALAVSPEVGGRITIEVRDRRGNPVTHEDVKVASPFGILSEPIESQPGLYALEVKVPQTPPSWEMPVSVVVRDRQGRAPHRLMVGPESLRETSGTAQLVVAVVDEQGMPVADTQVNLRFCGPVQEARSDPFGRVELDLPNAGSGVLLNCEVQALGGMIRKRVALLGSTGGVRLLPLDLEAELPPGDVLRVQGTLRLHPLPGAQLQLSAHAPGSPGKPWVVEARLVDAAGAPLDGDFRFSSSRGTLGEVTRRGPGIYAVELQGAGESGETTVSALEIHHRVGGVLSLTPPKGSP